MFWDSYEALEFVSASKKQVLCSHLSMPAIVPQQDEINDFTTDGPAVVGSCLCHSEMAHNDGLQDWRAKS